MQLPEPSLLPALAVIAALIALMTDLRSRRIPNWLTGSALLIGLVVNTYLGGLQGTLSSVQGIGLGLAMLLPFYLLRTMGAGDVKLLAAFGALLGPQMLVSVAVYASILGGIQAMVILRRHRRLSLTSHQLF